jgi:hypothetical protein
LGDGGVVVMVGCVPGEGMQGWCARHCRHGRLLSLSWVGCCHTPPHTTTHHTNHHTPTGHHHTVSRSPARTTAQHSQLTSTTSDSGQSPVTTPTTSPMSPCSIPTERQSTNARLTYRRLTYRRLTYRRLTYRRLTYRRLTPALRGGISGKPDIPVNRPEGAVIDADGFDDLPCRIGPSAQRTALPDRSDSAVG